MAQITYPDGIAIFKLIYYLPALLISLYVSYKHGFQKGSGWIFLTIFCIIRIIGGAAQLATIDNKNPHDAETVALVTAVLGLSPLLLATLGILARM
jgi:low temperature requirement protein LtrA